MAKESAFVGIAFDVANQLLHDSQFQIARKAALLYRITVDNQLSVRVDVRKPMRGKSAFETDLCVFEKRIATNGDAILIPRVVMEFKTSITTHDMLTYSVKAKQTKQIYPYLRYGMVAENQKKVQGLFFAHNESLDFCASVADLADVELSKFFSALLRSEIAYSQKLEAVSFDKANVKSRLYQNVPMFDGVPSSQAF